MLNCRTVLHLQCQPSCYKQTLNLCSSSTFQLTGNKLNKCYELLGLKNECTKDELKSKYLQLAKKYHPDSADAESNSDKFRQICEAYKYIVDNDYGPKDKEDLQNLPKIYDIRHTAPQHRQYLEYGGIGYGTPSQRQRQYQQHRVQQAVENVNDYMVQKLMTNQEDLSLVSKSSVDAEYARKWKTRNAIDRLVEDLIQESMKKGEFKNLPGQGKPLKYESHNPYVDSTTHKLNQILIQNGYTPEWVLLEKEIKQEIKDIKELLKQKIKKLGASRNGWTWDEQKEWKEFLNVLNENCSSLNRRIDNFNLVCPTLCKQMVRFQLNKQAEKLLSIASSEENENLHKTKSIGEISKVQESSTEDSKQLGVFKNWLSSFYWSK